MGARFQAGPPGLSTLPGGVVPLAALAQPARLKARLSEWKACGASRTVLSKLAGGVKWRWARRPPPVVCIPNRTFSPEEALFVDTEIQRLLLLGAIREAEVMPHCVLPLSVVPKKGGKLRLVHDLRIVNGFLMVKRFRLEGLHEVHSVVQSGDVTCTVDLKDAYLHVPVNVAFQKYLGFQWAGRHYVWTALPFGLSLSPRVFVKTLRPVLAALRGMGLRVLLYMDDFLLAARPEGAPHALAQLLGLLSRLGFIVNERKVSEWAHETPFLGVVLDSWRDVLFRPAAKTLDGVRRWLREARRGSAVTARRLAAFLGLVNFLPGRCRAWCCLRGDCSSCWRPADRGAIGLC